MKKYSVKNILRSLSGFQNMSPEAMQAEIQMRNHWIGAGYRTGENRIRKNIRHEGIALEVPRGMALRPCLEGVLKAIYLLSNEGYHAAPDDFYQKTGALEKTLPCSPSKSQAQRRACVF